ncbi:flippase [Rheinheimera riviphila]|uniref:Flippase n=1 Tax=Rheinheimera riviphila TaxID=1834037 RepID=A0A437QSH7_9GAMM|nr:flippase [Rheinheimera riviphila]RVU37455.1 flippase [Rheinheimera riviphila]
MANYHKGAVFMLAEKLLKMASQLLMLVLMARVLAPDDLGQLMYCFALASIFLFLNQLGLDTLLVKKFVDQARKKQSLLWHAFAARLLAGVLCIVLVNGLGWLLVDAQHRNLLFIISLYHLFLPFSTFEWFFQAEGRSDLAAIGLIAGHVAGFALRLWCVLTAPDLAILASAYVLEVAVTALVYVLLLKQQQLKLPKVLSADRIQHLGTEALPLMISGAVILIYMKVDQLMLGLLSSAEEVAYYVAATRLSEAWYFVGLTVISVYFPKILKEKTNSTQTFEKSFVKLGRLIVILGSAIAIATYFFADAVIEYLYGPMYLKSIEVLQVTIFAVPLVYLGALSTRLYLELHNTRAVLYKSIFGLIINIVCNCLLIQRYGAIGAAIATVAAQATSGYFCHYLLGKDGKAILNVQAKIVGVKRG